MGQVRPKSELNQSPDGAVSQTLRLAFPFLSGDDRSEAPAQRVSSFSCGLGFPAPRRSCALESRLVWVDIVRGLR